MTRASVLALAGLLVGCGVPDVSFTPDDAAGDDATVAPDVQEGGGDDVDASASDDGSGDAQVAEGDADAATDAPYDGPVYCEDGGMPPPMGGHCCGPGNTGQPCYGTCNSQSCSACGPCSSPKVCCTKGSAGMCRLPPCPP